MTGRRPTILSGVALLVNFAFLPIPAEAAPPWTEQPFQPNGSQIAPFGYGSVLQELTTSPGSTGNSTCRSVSPLLFCHSVSGNADCGTSLPVGALVTCLSPAAKTVDESPFAPINCNGNAVGDGGVSGFLGNSDWCLAANYMPTRSSSTIYQFDDYVRLGVNNLFGGAIFELYGTDKIDRILQNGGAGVQLSLWAFTATYAPQTTPRGYFAVPSAASNWRGDYDSTMFSDALACQTAHPGLQCALEAAGPNYMTTPQVYPCAWNGAASGAPYNPLQAASAGCEWGQLSGSVDHLFAPSPGQITVTKNAPANYTRSDVMSGVNWTQTTQVSGPAAIVTYSIRSSSKVNDTDFQEIPAIFLHQGLGQTIFYYAGTKPYGDVTGPVTTGNITNSGVAALQLPKRPGPFGTGATATLTEDWVSTCDATGNTCVTIATFSSAAQDLIAAYGSSSSYFGVHGFFSLLNQTNRQVTVFMFPYRFDSVVMGRSIRAWIYAFRSIGSYSK